MTEVLLDQKSTYRAVTPDECRWYFKWDAETDPYGVHWGWYAFRQEPGTAHFSPEGRWKEIEVFRTLTLYSGVLTDDDWDNLRFWVNLGWEKEIAESRAIADKLPE